MSNGTRMDEQSVVTLGVAGGIGSGKTTVANAILDAVGRERIAYLEIQCDSQVRVKISLDTELGAVSDREVDFSGRDFFKQIGDLNVGIFDPRQVGIRLL